jgi:hypothetical protein
MNDTRLGISGLLYSIIYIIINGGRTLRAQVLSQPKDQREEDPVGHVLLRHPRERGRERVELEPPRDEIGVGSTCR